MYVALSLDFLHHGNPLCVAPPRGMGRTGDNAFQKSPRHTVGHICYYATEGEQKVVFTGDVLFVGGAGRFFEGTPEDMQLSMDKLGKLPPETLVYCGHEVSCFCVPFQ